MTTLHRLAPLARQRRLVALAALARPQKDNVIAVDFCRRRRTAPTLTLDLGMRQVARHRCAMPTALPCAA